MITVCFALWGFANDITNPMVAAFKNILLINNFESSLVQAAFYGGYALMAIPAAIFIKRFSYKKGLLIGLALYALGCLLFIPSGWSMQFAPFLLAYLIMTCGLSFLETTANPYILSMGDEATSTRRLNLAQAFNPLGSIAGMFVASMCILVNLDGTTESARRSLLATAGGKPVIIQTVDAQRAIANDLESVVRQSDWSKKKRWLKKAQEQAAGLSHTLTLMADPQATQAKALREAIAAQPQMDKFASSLKAVAVVLQLREPVQPTEAERQRDDLFFGRSGMDLAILLGNERSLLNGQTALAQADASLATVLGPAKTLSDLLMQMYQRRDGNSEDVKTAVQLLATVKAGIESTQASLNALQTEGLKDYFAQAGSQLKSIQKSDLTIVVWPYALMGVFLIMVLALYIWKLPSGIGDEGSADLDLKGTLGRLVRNARYLEGVIAQTFYVGAQIMCWTFIIQYAELELGLSKATAQNCNILAMVIFVTSRFICTFLLHYIKPGLLLGLLAMGGLLLTAGTIFIQGYAGLYCMIGVSACMSLMFPTIYGIALRGLGDDAKLGSAGLILAIGGGCLMPPLQGAIIDLPPFDLGFMELASVRASFVLPLICFAVIAHYGWKTERVHLRSHTY
jgi:fucose permease